MMPFPIQTPKQLADREALMKMDPCKLLAVVKAADDWAAMKFTPEKREANLRAAVLALGWESA